MSLSRTRMHELLRKELGGLDSADLTEDEADELLNMSLWDIESKFPFELKETCYSVATVNGQQRYGISSIIDFGWIHSVAIIDEHGQRHKLARATRDWWDENVDEDVEDNGGIPTRYLRENELIFLDPIPDSTDYTIELNIREDIESLSVGNVQTGLPRNWDEIVLAGAAWRGHKQRGDYNQAQQAANFYTGLLRSAVTTEAKEERDSRYAGLDVLHDWPAEAE